MKRSRSVLDRILLTNDDGIDAPGLQSWRRSRHSSRARCGSSHRNMIRAACRMRSVCITRCGSAAWPAPLWRFRNAGGLRGHGHLPSDDRRAPQLLLSGVNRGLNLGMETVFSGTVGGAMTGMMFGVPSIALSQAYKDRNNVLWDASRTLGAQVVRELLAIGWSKDACLNVNFPACPAAEAGPITLARQGVGRLQGCTWIRVPIRAE